MTGVDAVKTMGDLEAVLRIARAGAASLGADRIRVHVDEALSLALAAQQPSGETARRALDAPNRTDALMSLGALITEALALADELNLVVVGIALDQALNAVGGDGLDPIIGGRT